MLLSLVPALKQQFNELINGKSQRNRDQKSNFLFSQRHNSYWKIWFKLTKYGQKIVQRHWYLLYWVYYNKKNGNCENIYSVNPFYLVIGKVDGHIKEKNRSKF